MSSLVSHNEKRDIKNKIINMKVISKLQPDVKLDTGTTLFKIYEASGYIPIWFTRWWAVHNRKTDIARVILLYEEVLKILEENKELRKLLTTQQEQISGLIPKVGNNNTSNQFNLNFFLNELINFGIKKELSWPMPVQLNKRRITTSEVMAEVLHIYSIANLLVA